jgi:predicted nucleotidyltransferase
MPLIEDVQFPTAAHEAAFWKTVEVLKKKPEVLAVGLGGSIARNQGSFDADVDVDVFPRDRKSADVLWKEMEKILPRIERSFQNKNTGKFFGVGIQVRSLNPTPAPRSWTSGPDEFEIEIGMSFVYLIPVFQRGRAYDDAQKKFLPYYGETLRRKRLAEVKKYCISNTDHIKPYVKRRLYFQAFKRLCDASRELLQAVFIAKRTYPIAYDKWVKYQLEEILKLPKLYRELVPLYEIRHLESNELVGKGEKVRKLLRAYA